MISELQQYFVLYIVFKMGTYYKISLKTCFKKYKDILKNTSLLSSSAAPDDLSCSKHFHISLHRLHIRPRLLQEQMKLNWDLKLAQRNDCVRQPSSVKLCITVIWVKPHLKKNHHLPFEKFWMMLNICRTNVSAKFTFYLCFISSSIRRDEREKEFNIWAKLCIESGNPP